MQSRPIGVVKEKFAIALKIWWWVAWRSLLSLAAAAAVSAAAGFFAVKNNIIGTTPVFIVCAAFALFVFVLAGIIFTKKALNKRFKGFSVVLVKTD